MNIDRLPEEKRDELIEVVERTGKQIAFSDNDLNFMFDMWEGYFEPNEKQDRNCKGCRTRIIGKLRMYVQDYRQAQHR